MNYRQGIGVEYDINQALELDVQAGKRGEPIGFLSIGRFYDRSVAHDENEVQYALLKAAEYYLKAIKYGDCYSGHASARLGEMYLKGQGVSPDFPKAFKLLERSSRKGNPDAYYLLGQLYHEGIKVPQDLEKAHYLYKKAAKSGKVEAQDALAAVEK